MAPLLCCIGHASGKSPSPLEPHVCLAGKLDWWDIVEAFEQSEEQQIFVELCTDKARAGFCVCDPSPWADVGTRCWL